ncbi:MAG: tetratricopeptide repeat protein [Verrucomicrobiales bacterium]
MENESEEASDVIGLNELPDNLRKLYFKAESALEVRNWGYAMTLIQAILKAEPKFLHGRRQLRLAAVKENEGKKGVKLGGEALKVMKLQGQVKKNPHAVMLALEKDVLSVDPYNDKGGVLLYEAAVKAELPMTAGFALETLTTGHPNNPKFYHQLGDFYLDREKFDEAAEIFGKLADKDRSDLEATKKYKDATARGSIRSQKWDSEGDWRDLLKDKDSAKDLEQSGRAAMTPEMLQQQVESLAVQYEADNSNLDVTKRLADTYEQLEDFPTALSYYEWAFHLSANDPALEQKVANLREKIGKNHVRDLKVFIEENPEHPEIETYKTQLKDHVKQQAEGLILEAQARVDRNPTDNELRYELAEKLFQVDRYKDAVKHLQAAKRSPSLRIQVMNILGQCYDKMGISDLAVQQFEEAIAELTGMNDVKKELLYNLGVIHDKTGESEKALDSFKQIYSADYDYGDVAERVENSYGV